MLSLKLAKEGSVCEIINVLTGISISFDSLADLEGVQIRGFA